MGAQGRRTLRKWLTPVAIVVAVAGVVCWTHSGREQRLLDDARAAQQSRDYAAQLAISSRILQEFGQSREALRLYAAAAESLRRWRDASEAYGRLAALEQTSQGISRAWLSAGRCLMQADLVRGAEDCLLRSIEASPGSAEPHRLLAQIYAVEGRSRDLEHELLTLVRLDEHTADDLILLARPDPYIDDPERRDALLAADPEYRVPLLAAARTAWNNHRAGLAEENLRDVIQAYPDQLEAHIWLGALLAERPDFDVRRWLESLPQDARTDSHVWLIQGGWLREHGYYEPAVRCSWEAFRRRPESLTAANQLGLALAAAGDDAGSRRFLDYLSGLRTIAELTHQIDLEDSLGKARGLIDELEARGRLWEAWGWCRLVEEQSPHSWAVARATALRSRLQEDTPRTITAALPGDDRDWSLFELPQWDAIDSGSPDTPVAEADSSSTEFRFAAHGPDLGLDFTFQNGDDPATPGKRIFESTGGGLASLDFDLDGWPDLYLVQGGTWPTGSEASAPADQLYRNLAARRFQNVTSLSGIHEPGFGQGVATGDFDSDGFPDLYVANMGRNRLFHNAGDGTYEDVSDFAGLKSESWTISCLMMDLDRDAQPDLFDVNYAEGDDAFRVICTDVNGEARACRPTVFPAAPEVVEISRGDGRFEQHGADVGLEAFDGRGMGIVAGDFRGDGGVSLFIANDMTSNFLFDVVRSASGGLQFTDRGLLAGVAADQDGRTQASMGVASGDLNADGVLDLLVTNFAEESSTLYVSLDEMSYLVATRDARLREPSFPMLGFGAEFIDADLNGVLDLLVLNGHVDDFTYIGQEYRMRPQFFRGSPDVRFTEVAAEELGEYFVAKHLGRGLSILDWNRDGAPDAAVTHLEEPVALLENRTARRGHFLQLQLIGTSSARIPFGTRVKVSVAGITQHLQLTGGNGYSTSHERLLTIGLGEGVGSVDQAEIIWSSGAVEQFGEVLTDQRYVAVEGRGRLIPLPLAPTDDDDAND